MATLEQLARAGLDRDSLRLRSLAQDLIRETTRLSTLPRPAGDDPRLLAMAASLVELLAARNGQAPPAWTQDIGPMPEPFYLLESALRMKRLRQLCETESPEPMRKRRLGAPPYFLHFA